MTITTYIANNALIIYVYFCLSVNDSKLQNWLGSLFLGGFTLVLDGLSISISSLLYVRGAAASNLSKLPKIPSHKLKYHVIYAFKRLCMWKKLGF